MIAADRPDRRSRQAAGSVAADGSDAAPAARRAGEPVRARRPGRCQRRRDLAGEPARHACRERRADRDPACRLGVARRSRRASSPLRSVRAIIAPAPKTGRRRRSLSPGDRLSLGPLAAIVERLLDHPRLFELRFAGNRAAVLAGLARHGRPIQYAHVPEPLALWDVWTQHCRRPGRVRAAVGRLCARLAHARGLAAARHRLCHADARRRHLVDRRSRARPAAALRRALSHTRAHRGGDRAGEARRRPRSSPSARPWCARSKPPPMPTAACAPETASPAAASARGTRLRVVDAILTGVHQPGESHFELLRAFADDAVLERISAALADARLPRSRVRRFHAAVAPGEPAAGAGNSRLAARACHWPRSAPPD